MVSGLTIGGTVIWTNTAMVAQSGGDVVLAGANAILFNALSGTFDIADDSDVGRGSSTASYIRKVGLFEKTAGAGMSVIAPGMVNGGTISAVSGLLDVHGALSGSGKDEIGGGATLEVDATVAAGQTFIYQPTGGELALDDLDVSGAQLFHGDVSGFGVGDTLDAGAPFGTGTTFVYTENSARTAGVLALTDGSMHASIAFLGNYATTNFGHASDGRGGTAFTFKT